MIFTVSLTEFVNIVVYLISGKMKSRKYSYRFFYLTFLAIILLVVSTALVICFSQRDAIRDAKSNELSTLHILKVKQFLGWKNERISDALFLKKNPDFIYHFEQLLKTPESISYKKNLAEVSISIISTGHYKSLIFLDNTGKQLLWFPDSAAWKCSILIDRHYLDSAQLTDEIIMTNLHFAPDSQIIFHLVVPLTKVTFSEKKCIGYLLLNIDPETEFYPFLQTFQIGSRTAEAILIRKEGDQIVFLNELRYKKGTALRMKLPLETKNLAASKAVQGMEGVVNAVDYRNKKILAAIGPVTGTDWFLIVKKDASEVFSEFGKVTIGTWTISILLIVAGFLTLRIFWLKRIAMYEKEKLQLEYDYKFINNKYSLVSKYANDAIVLWDREHKIIDVNDRALELYGYEAGEMTGLRKEQLRPEKFRKDLKDVTDILEFTAGSRYETMHQRKDGTIFPVEISTRCFTIDNKTHYQSIIRDITDRKNAENAIRESEEKYHQLFEHIDNCVAVYKAIDKGEDFIFKDFNKAAEIVEKKKGSEIVGKRVTEVFPGIVNFGLLEIFRRVWKTGIPEKYPAKIYEDSRISGWRENYVYKLPCGEIVAVYQDVTGQKMILENLRESEERLRLALKSAKQGLYDLDLQTGQAVVSPEYETMLGYEPGELQETNKKWQKRLHPEDREMTYKMYEDYIAGKINEYHAEFRQKTKTGNWIWILSLGEIVERDNTGKPLRMLGTHTDITRRKLAEDEIVRLNVNLEQKVFERTSQLAAKNRELESFTYSVSHDLKAPLRGIDGYTLILMEEYSKELNDTAKKYLVNIRDNAMQMNRLIDDLLEYSRIERYTLNTGTLNLRYAVAATLDQILKEYPDNRIKTDIQVPEKEITVNFNGLTIALRNLIENAVKFTKTADDPKIEIGFKEKDESYVLFVRDNGIGFAMQYHDRIFEIFQRLHRIEDYPGTGIGLAMVKKAMERMGGKVWAESSPGKGSVFYLEIPKT
jgi:PAS domain S-box-containing protein